MMKLLLGGSPCTYWSIAQSKNRETKPEGLGWELVDGIYSNVRGFEVSALGKTVFLTREEAEAATSGGNHGKENP